MLRRDILQVNNLFHCVGLRAWRPGGLRNCGIPPQRQFLSDSKPPKNKPLVSHGFTKQTKMGMTHYFGIEYAGWDGKSGTLR